MEAYLDYNATSPLDPAVLEAMKPYLSDQFGNASSFHQKGQVARNAIEVARETLADHLQVEPGDLFFTSGGTESDNLAIKGLLQETCGRRKHLTVSTIEHQAVLYPARHLESEGFKVTTVRVNADGLIDLSALADAITDETALVSLMHVNNETGVIQPIEEAARLAHAKGALFHTDAVQSFGKIPIEIERWGIDLLSLSSHKICGPKGVGALFVKKGLKIKALLHGGHQEKNIRPGTENVAGIVGFGKAVELLSSKAHEEEIKKVTSLRDRLERGLREAVSDVRLNGHETRRVYNTSNLSFKGLDGETLLVNMDLKSICVSTGSACTAGSVEPSHVLLAMGMDESFARAAIRFSLGRFTTGAEVDYVLEELPGIVRHLRAAATSRKK